MLSKCANPECSTPFRYLREGKVFRLDVEKTAEQNGNAPHLLTSRKPNHRVEHFWLCGSCAAVMTLGWEKDQGVQMVPLRAMARAAKAS